jgi:effector-binding domain-containing protein
VAAISDFTFEKFEGKIPSKEDFFVKLTPLPKLVEIIREKYPSTYMVGFKAEYNVSDEELIKRAKNKLKESKLDMVVANDVAKEGAGFGTDTNEVIIVDEKIIKKLGKLPKTEIAKIIIDLIAEKIDLTQKEIIRILEEEIFNIPVLSYSQLLGLAMGMSTEELGLQYHRVKTKELFEKPTLVA